MARSVAIGEDDFTELITEDCFYIDKTMFIKEWWESGFGRLRKRSMRRLW